jgi:hypothetical protein
MLGRNRIFKQWVIWKKACGTEERSVGSALGMKDTPVASGVLLILSRSPPLQREFLERFVAPGAGVSPDSVHVPQRSIEQF